VVLVAIYGLQLWYLQGARLKGVTKQLLAVQHLVALWITGCFQMSPTSGMEALTGLLPMYILLKCLVAHSCAHTATLGHSYPVRVVLEPVLVGLAPLVLLGLGGLSLAVKCWLISPVKDAIAKCAEFMEMFQALHPEMELGNRVTDIFPNHIVQHLAPKMSNDQYGNYIKQIDGALTLAKWDVTCVHTLSDTSVPSKGVLQASLAALVFQGNTRVACIVAAGGRAMAPNAELMALELSISTALALAACTALWQ